jgi:hypothetical protein
MEMIARVLIILVAALSAGISHQQMPLAFLQTENQNPARTAAQSSLQGQIPLQELPVGEYKPPSDQADYPTLEEFSSYLQYCMQFYDVQAGGPLARWLWDASSTPEDSVQIELLAFPVAANSMAGWDWYGVDRESGKVYRWGNNAGHPPQEVLPPEIFPTPISALEYAKAYFVDTADATLPFVYELSYTPGGMPYYQSQTILPQENSQAKEYTSFIEITDTSRDGYGIHIYDIVMDSPDEGHTATRYWLTIYKHGFIVDRIVPNTWIVPERKMS